MRQVRSWSLWRVLFGNQGTVLVLVSCFGIRSLSRFQRAVLKTGGLLVFRGYAGIRGVGWYCAVLVLAVWN